MQLADSATTDWVRRYHPAPSATSRLVCFAYAGGAASFFHPMSARLAPAVDVVALQYPGRQDRRHEPGVDTIGALADQIADELRALSEKPTIFFGHSMGATLAFEVARRLEHDGPGAPLAIIASGRRGPSTQRGEEVLPSSDDEIIAELRRLHGTGASLQDDEVMRMSLPALRSDYRAIAAYTSDAGRTVRCPITVMTGDADPKTTLDEARAWSEHTEGSFRCDVYTGGHFFIADHQEAINDEIADQLKALAS